MVDATEANQVTTAASSLLFSGIDFGVASNATYRREDFEPVLSRIAFDNEFANAGAKAYSLARGDDVDLDATARNPLTRALLYNPRALDANGIDEQFDALCEAVLTHAAHERIFQKPIDLAIDVHDWLFYGDEETPKVANMNPEQGTTLAYKFATLCIVSPNVRFTLEDDSQRREYRRVGGCRPPTRLDCSGVRQDQPGVLRPRVLPRASG